MFFQSNHYRYRSFQLYKGAFCKVITLCDYISEHTELFVEKRISIDLSVHVYLSTLSIKLSIDSSNDANKITINYSLISQYHSDVSQLNDAGPPRIEPRKTDIQPLQFFNIRNILVRPILPNLLLHCFFIRTEP